MAITKMKLILLVFTITCCLYNVKAQQSGSSTNNTSQEICITCRMFCPYGFVMDTNGCPKCECQAAPDPTHPCQNYTRCSSSQVCKERSITNCNSPPCNPVAECTERPCITCRMACPYGFVMGSNGCPKCECKPAPDPTHPCKNYSLCASTEACFELTAANCNSSTCNPVVECRARPCITCRMACPYGFVMGSNGCPKCECKPTPDPTHPCKNYSLCASTEACFEMTAANCNSSACNPVVECRARPCITCRMACPYGFVMGSNGCPKCECKPAPDPTHPCKNYTLCGMSQLCKEETIACNATGCNPIIIPKCTARPCITCRMACPYGFVMGSNGCPKCECKPTPDPTHPCKNYSLCASTEACFEMTAANCNSSACNPVVECRARPCITCRMACPYGFVMGPNGCPKCECKPAPDPTHPCKNYTLCGMSQFCKEETIACNATGCNPIIIPKCTARPCINCLMACPYGFVMGSNGCPKCECKPAPDTTHPCKNYTLCGMSQFCKEETIACNATGCNPIIIPKCTARPCISCAMACPYGFVMGSNGCPKCECALAPDPIHPCKNFTLCATSQMCRENKVANCSSPPCNPVPQCVARPCISCAMACPYGFVMGSNGCPKCECASAPDPIHPCKNFSLCATSQMCRETQITNCNSPPCNPVAKCVARPCISCAMACPYGFVMGSNGCPKCECALAPDPSHPCKNFTLCATSQMCRENKVANCSSPPCNPVPQCVARPCISCAMACPYGFVMGSNGCPKCECATAPDPIHPCKNFSLCATSQMCRETQITNCNSAPCNPVATCVARPCISCAMACPYGFVMGSNGCPKCECALAPDATHPCKNFTLCATSQICRENQVANCSSPPCNPVPQCVARPCITCRMACPYGFVMGSNGCPKCECKPAPDPTHPCKNYTLCGNLQVCKEETIACNRTGCNPIITPKCIALCRQCRMACEYGFVMGTDGCPLCKCNTAPNPAHPCQNYTLCSASQICREKPAANCNSSTCNPVVECSARPCINCLMACPYGFVMGSNGCPKCECRPAPDPTHPCKNYSLCSSTQVCFEKPVTNCNSSSCNPVLECRARPCITCRMACPYGFVMGSNGCPKCECAPAPDPTHPCKNYSLCSSSQACFEKAVTNCNSSSCNPVIECRARPCISCLMACPYGFMMGSNGCPKCECKPAPDPTHPCKNYTLCGNLQVCKEETIACNRTGCNPIITPKCIALCRQCRRACEYGFVMGTDGCPLCKCNTAPNPAHPCQNYTLCSASQICREKPAANCNSSTCNPVVECRARPCISCLMACPYGFVMGSNGCPKCECKPAPDPTHPCKNYSLCSSTQVCFEKAVTNCNSSSCNPVLECRARPCITCRMACPYGFVMGSNGCPKCECKPAPDPTHPCKNYSLCSSTQVCFEKAVTNCNSSSCNPVIECRARPCITCRMACPYGFVMGSNGCPKCECAPAPDPTHPCKNYSLCSSTQVCFEKAVTNCNSSNCNPVIECRARPCITCRMACPYGFVMGSNGCPKCECAPASDPTHPCKNYTFCGRLQVCKEETIACNRTGCTPTVTPKCTVLCRQCRMACAYGFVMGTDGCPLCKCKTAPNPANPCQNYSLCPPSQICKEKQLTTCSSPPCRIVPQCATPCRQCMIACDYGFVMGSDGCPKCECKSAPNPMHPCQNYTMCGRFQECREEQIPCNRTGCNPAVIAKCRAPCRQCLMACPYGFVMGSDGCPKCECKSAPNPMHPCQGYSSCPSGHMCQERRVTNCLNPPCHPMPTCTRVCAQCRMFCAYGNEMGQDGCPKCQCKPAPDPFDPCRGYLGCAKDQVCQSKTVQCESSPCYPQPECRAAKKCSFGQPLVDIYNKEIFCGRGLNRKNCPAGFMCNVDPLDRFAVCCPDASFTTTRTPWKQCPALPRGYGGGCYEECRSDHDCAMKFAGETQCCPTECGHACIYTGARANDAGRNVINISSVLLLLLVELLIVQSYY